MSGISEGGVSQCESTLLKFVDVDSKIVVAELEKYFVQIVYVSEPAH